MSHRLLWSTPGCSAFVVVLAGLLPGGAAASTVFTPYFTAAGVGSVTPARAYATAEPLPSGDVLLAGGYNNVSNHFSSSELFDPATDAFTAIATAMTTQRAQSAAAPLLNGAVLIAGGASNTQSDLASADLFDPTTGAFSGTAGTIPTAETGAIAAPLPDGDVLVAGGLGTAGPLSSAELYDPASQTFTPVSGALVRPAYDQAAAPLPNGDVLMAGGNGGSAGLLASAELYNPTTQTFVATTGSMTTKRQGAVAVSLPDGFVLVAGGIGPTGGLPLSSAELYNPTTERFTLVPAPMTIARAYAAAAPLPGGDALIAGGNNGSSTYYSSAELFVPATQASVTGGALGNVAVGQTSGDQVVTVQDVGPQTLPITGATLTGVNAGDFSIISDGCAGVTLAATQSCTLSLNFTPSAASSESATLELQDNRAASPGSTAVSGTGVAPAPVVAPPPVAPTPAPQTPVMTAPSLPPVTSGAGAPGLAAPASCPPAQGRRFGRGAIGALSLGQSPEQANHAYRDGSDRGYPSKDFFCLSSGASRVGFGSSRLLSSLPAAQRDRYRGTVVWVSSAVPTFVVHGIRTGFTLKRAMAHLPGGNELSVGLNDWYFARDGTVTALLKVRHGVVEEIGKATRALTLTRPAQWRFMTSFNQR